MNEFKYELYNNELKTQYIDSLDNPVKETFAHFTFKKTKDTEIVYGKDIYNMSRDEIGKAMKDMESTSIQSLYNIALTIEDYINWAMKHRKSNINPLANILNKYEWSGQFVASYRNNYYTRDEVEDMMMQLVNPQDKAVLLALFEGIKGKGFSEIIKLQEKDIKEVEEGKYKVRLHDEDGEVRYIEISELLAMTLINTANRPNYISKNGKSFSNQSETDLEDTPYIFKKTIRGKQGDGSIDYTFVTRKFLLYKDVFENTFLKAKNIIDSGIMYMAHTLQEDGVLTSDDLVKIAEQFDTTWVVSGDRRYRNTTLIKRIVSIPEFENLYGYKLKFN